MPGDRCRLKRAQLKLELLDRARKPDDLLLLTRHYSVQRLERVVLECDARLDLDEALFGGWPRSGHHTMLHPTPVGLKPRRRAMFNA